MRSYWSNAYGPRPVDLGLKLLALEQAIAVEGAMCSHYQTLKDAERLLERLGAPNKPTGGKHDRSQVCSSYVQGTSYRVIPCTW